MRASRSGVLNVVGALLGLVSCIPMVGMLPAGFAAFLGLLGMTSAPIVSWAKPLTPLAPELLILSVVLLTIGNLRCGWQPAGLVALGGLLVYVAMYVAATPPPNDVMNSMSGMTGISPIKTSSTLIAGSTNASLFYIGLTLMVASFGLVLWRHWRRTCHPFNPLAFLPASKQN